MKKRIIGCLLSVVSVYLTTHYLFNLFITVMNNFTFNVL